ncbi:MAG: hypothetical protein KC414_11380, partial [Romboutsia sp.]|nr:hypothetical protein [Romboutsia sp.]
WRINEFYDYTNKEGKAIIKKEDCLPFLQPINYICKNRCEQTQKGRVLEDNIYYTRLEKVALPDKKMYIKNMVLLDKRNIK